MKRRWKFKKTRKNQSKNEWKAILKTQMVHFITKRKATALGDTSRRIRTKEEDQEALEKDRAAFLKRLKQKRRAGED